ncbi:MAG: DUF1957 domain-containing protein [Treponema sp.]|nr:DUF1957 domain-containing protein [Treponema sp.]
MSVKNLVFVLTCHQGYIRHIEDEKKYEVENNILFSSISSTYLPLLRMLERLEQNQKSCPVSIVISPVVCGLLGDPVVQQQYIEWLERRIELGERELKRCGADAALQAAAVRCLDRFKRDKNDFCEKYGQNLLKAFAVCADKGLIEPLATAGSYAFLPHYSDMPEILNAQVEIGLYSHRSIFGTLPDGFWLPDLGYVPGIEKVLRSYGMNYTFVDTHAVLFSESAPETGIFTPVRCQNSLVLFARDAATPEDILGESGFSGAGVYRAQDKDIGFELSAEDLGDFSLPGEARVATGFRYWTKGGDVYDADAARAQLKKDAAAFVSAKKALLDKAQTLLADKDVTLCCAIPLDQMCSVWDEGVDFLEEVISQVQETDLVLTTGKSLLGNQFSLQKIVPYPSAASGTGYGEDLLDSTNGWMLRYTRKMCERMVDLAGRFPNDTGLKARLLNLGARELMIALGLDWPKMLHEGQEPEYVAEHFKAAIRAFITVFDALGSNTVSTEWLTRCEREHTLFPWINYRVFSRKK